MNSTSKITVGWRELIALPDWHIPKLRAKIDTGAKTSALDVDQIELLSNRKIRFDVVLSNNHRRRRKWITADIVRTTVIKSSNGERETRYVVATTLEMGTRREMAEFTLVRRENMLCRMLIGRTALSPHYIVDAGRTYLTRKRVLKKKSK